MNQEPTRRAEDRDARDLDRMLRDLPLVAAPEGLRLRVMQSIERRAVGVWWQRAYWDWPPVVRWLAVVLGVVLGCVAIWLGAGVLGALASRGVEVVAEFLGPVVGLVRSVLAVLMRAVTTCAGRVSPTAWAIGGVMLGGVYASSLGVGTMFWRIANSRE